METEPVSESPATAAQQAEPSPDPFFLPCPFCGGKARMAAYPKREHDTLAFLAAECVCCGARGPVSSGVDTEKCRKKWNDQIKADAAYSAFYILEDADPERLAEVCGLPYGVITAALRNIIPPKTLDETENGN